MKTNCKHMIFCPTWAENKCTKKSIKFMREDGDDCDDCPFFEPLKTYEEHGKCNCKDCTNGGGW